MRGFFSASPVFAAVILCVRAQTAAADPPPHASGGTEAVATVNGEPITAREFVRARLGLDAQQAAGRATPVNDEELLRRMITVRLMAQEAAAMGLDELPEVKKLVDAFSKVSLRDLLIARITTDVRPEESEVERLYREAAEEYKITVVMFERGQEGAAKETEKQIAAGGNFVEIAQKLAQDGKARISEGREYVRGRDLVQPVLDAVRTMKAGAVSTLIAADSAYVIFRLEDRRLAEDQKARAWAEQESLSRRKEAAVTRYYRAIKSKYAAVDTRLLRSLNFESSVAGFNRLLKDRRVVAAIRGEAPVTVGDLAAAIKKKLFHGVEKSVEKKKINRDKELTLDEVLFKRLFRKEALRLGLDRTEEYRSRLREYEVSMIFGAFVQKVVVPSITVGEDDLSAYYEARRGEFPGPEMITVDGVAFGNRAAAERALAGLRAGTDFKWLKENAEGQTDRSGLDAFAGRPVSRKALPEGVARALAGVRSGEYALADDSDGRFFVLLVRDVAPPSPMPFEEVRETVRKRVYDERLSRAVEEWAAKLWAASDVTIHRTNAR